MTDILTRAKGVVIAEAGTNHADPNPHKRVGKAARYAELAAEAGADIVKYQIFANPIKDDFFCWLPISVRTTKGRSDSLSGMGLS